jgi:hypothetical protein
VVYAVYAAKILTRFVRPCVRAWPARFCVGAAAGTQLRTDRSNLSYITPAHSYLKGILATIDYPCSHAYDTYLGPTSSSFSRTFAICPSLCQRPCWRLTDRGFPVSERKNRATRTTYFRYTTCSSLPGSPNTDEIPRRMYYRDTWPWLTECGLDSRLILSIIDALSIPTIPMST